MNKETISVIMATYNGAHYIAEQLDSIYNQSITPDEIIISDDCSMDHTLKIIEEYKSKGLIPITISVNKSNLGYIKNFNLAISKAKGDYIFLCDQDDVWETNKIEITLSSMNDYSADVACTGFKLIDKGGTLVFDMNQFRTSPIIGYQNWTNNVYPVLFNRLIWGNFCPGCTYCIRKSVLHTFLEISNVSISHDYQLLLIGSNRGKAIFIDCPLIRYRIHDKNTIGMTKKIKGKKHLKPNIVIFLSQLNKIEHIQHFGFYKIILYLRLPRIKKLFVQKFQKYI